MKADLDTLVVTEIQNLINNQQSFTAHDVTKNIRAGIGAGVLEIENFPFEDINGVRTQRVDHEDVRDSVRRYFGSGPVQGYGPTYGNGFTMYAPVPPTAAPLAALDTTLDDAPTQGPSSPLPATHPSQTPSGATFTTVPRYPNLTSEKIQHRLWVRPGVQVTFSLPEDLTADEADRLADFISGLPYVQDVPTALLRNMLRHPHTHGNED